MVYWPGYLLIICEVIPTSVHGIQAFAFSTGGGKCKKKKKNTLLHKQKNHTQSNLQLEAMNN